MEFGHTRSRQQTDRCSDGHRCGRTHSPSYMRGRVEQSTAGIVQACKRCPMGPRKSEHIVFCMHYNCSSARHAPTQFHPPHTRASHKEASAKARASPQTTPATPTQRCEQQTDAVSQTDPSAEAKRLHINRTASYSVNIYIRSIYTVQYTANIST